MVKSVDVFDRLSEVVGKDKDKDRVTNLYITARESILIANELERLKSLNAEMLAAFKNLLNDAKYYYQYYPNNFRATEAEQFKDEDDLIRRAEEVKP